MVEGAAGMVLVSKFLMLLQCPVFCVNVILNVNVIEGMMLVTKLKVFDALVVPQCTLLCF